ncbi:MAG: hypothetical protein QM802_06365 [Agriterribacter sp.]
MHRILFYTIWLLLSFEVSLSQPPKRQKSFALATNALLVDLNADAGVITEDGNKVSAWQNNAFNSPIKVFNKRDEGRAVAGSGRPELVEKVKALNEHNSIIFLQQELLNSSETAFDSLINGSGFTWIAIVRPYTQKGELRDVNSFFGSLKNGGNYEGFWAGFTDENFLWTGARNGITFGRWDNNNQRITSTMPLDTSKYYLLVGRMQKGNKTALVELFINDLSSANAGSTVPVNTKADGSMLSIGQERDAIQHPGVESFRGEIARFIVYGRPLGDNELFKYGEWLKDYYGITEH